MQTELLVSPFNVHMNYVDGNYRQKTGAPLFL